MSLSQSILKGKSTVWKKFLAKKVQKEGKELKKLIEDGYIPDEPTIRGLKNYLLENKSNE